MVKQIRLPLTREIIRTMRSGDEVRLTGTLYVARDAAHHRMVASLAAEEPLPFNIADQIIYYMGPAPARPGQVIGSAGPTTSGRMDLYFIRLMEHGLKGTIGKGPRSRAVKEAMRRHGAIYLAAIGGAGALISKSIIRSEIIAYPELGAEAVLRIEVRGFPATVINDVYGGDFYEESQAKYRTPPENS
jgi:fumarate hydratase subunit beta